MSRFSAIQTSLALPAALMLAQSAAADVTPVQVWGDWKQYMQDLGYQITAEEQSNGSDVAVSTMTITMPATETGGTVVLRVGPMTFAQDGGDVNVMLPDSLPIVLDGSEATVAGEAWKLGFAFDQTGHSLKVSGDPEAMTYAYSSDTFALSLQEFVADGESYGPQNARINITGTDARTTTQMITGDLRQYAQTGSIGEIGYDIFLHNPVEDVKVGFTGNTTALAFDGTSTIPTGVEDAADMAQMLRAGFAVDGGFTYGPGTMNITVEQPVDGDFAASTTSDGGRLGVDMSAKRLGYEAVQNNLKASVSSAELPFPVEMSMAQAGFDLAMPVAQSDTAEDFSFGINLTDFVMADLLWSIFDPAAQLPRDPATLELDLSGKAKMLVDLMNPEAAAATDAPGEIHALTIDKVLLDAVGAKVEASGDFTFDNADTTTFDGFPKPVGAVNVAIAGGNALLDKLVAMGILPQQQAMGARMMMGLFAVAGDAPDTLKSTVEFNEAGQVLANGQRLK